MERTTWTDERLDDLARRVDAGFDRVDADMRELRAEVRQQGSDLRLEMAGFRHELVGEIATLRVAMLRLGGGLLAAMAAVLASNLLGS